MAKRARPSQGVNSIKKIVKLAAGRTNERVLQTSRNTNNRKRRAT